VCNGRNFDTLCWRLNRSMLSDSAKWLSLNFWFVIVGLRPVGRAQELG
jgi:hypothetical protein